jgi:hypothetical protein
MRVIIIGGTGMLSSATREISHQANDLVLIARQPNELASEINARAIQLNWKNKDAVESAISKLISEPKVDILLIWIHEDGLWCLPLFENLLVENGRSIRVHGSTAGDPTEGVKTDPLPPRDDIIRQNVVLGWVEETNGRRWLTDNEISEGALAAFNNPERSSIVVGQVDKAVADTSNRLVFSKF